ncbi:beta-glucanase [Streptomyces sp. NPDC089919]|uniref:beta-glucanase n=1 Tax=Streptomyces sp. NPDC089919 TaxID=3155188 RepID=UPI003448F956
MDLPDWLERLLRKLGKPGDPGKPTGAPGPDGPGAPAPPNRPGAPGAVFTADFSSTSQWVAGRSWAYPDGGPTNHGDNKLDHLVPDPAYSRTGVFLATRREDGDWSAGLLTTEGSDEGFTLRTGDVLEAQVKLPDRLGAWPAIWTWYDGGSEIDVFEYHPDNPDLLELTNHVRGGQSYYRDPGIGPGRWIDLRVEFGARSVVWWVNGTRAFADHRGVGRRWRAHLIVNLSVCAGRYHPAPDPAVDEMSFEVSYLHVFRP